MKWKPYDPMWLVELAKEQYPEEIWLPNALARCTSYGEESRAYFYFVGPHSPTWQFERNIILDHKREGEVVLDVLHGNRIGGVEFLKQL